MPARMPIATLLTCCMLAQILLLCGAQHAGPTEQGGGVFLMNAHVGDGGSGVSAARFLLWQYAHIRSQWCTPARSTRHATTALRGIVENMRHAYLIRPQLEYAVVFSSRSLLAEAFDFAKGQGFLHPLRIPRPFKLTFDGATPLPPSHASWSHGARFINTSLARAVGHKVSGGFHECLVMPASTVAGLLAFADAHPTMMADLYATGTCVEEFALTTIACSLQLPVGWANCLKLDKSLRDGNSAGDGSWTWPSAVSPLYRAALQATCRQRPSQFAPPPGAPKPATFNDAFIRAVLDPCSALIKRLQAALRVVQLSKQAARAARVSKAAANRELQSTSLA
ncbi:hypothetical protein T492DRAFT_832383 [Pavlovales sp. CCMP2436]|nr:hypothetical protein T492DRAFT_832383 [Pavlovales sp. CCMP2436]